MKIVLLWSDILIYALTFSIVLFFVSLKNNAQTRNRWMLVFQSRVGLLSFVVILFYVFIALLDSIHYQKLLPATDAGQARSGEVHYASEVSSALDDILFNLKSHTEVTYSKPFALYSFAKENQYSAEGKLYRDYSRLRYAGMTLTTDSEKAGDILKRSAAALLPGLLITAVLVFFVMQIRQRLMPTLQLPWAVLYGCIAVLSLLTAWILKLGTAYHILGTDKVGVDVLYLSVKAIRTGILIGALSTLLTIPFAIGFGIAAGYFKGWVDDVIQYIYTTLSSIPDILLIAAAVLVLDVYIEGHVDTFEVFIQRADFKFLTLCFILGVTSWTGLCRLLRAETLKVSQLDYVQAAQAFGISHSGIIFRHILPNIMHLVLISMVLNFSTFVLAESVLSYIGVGVDASIISWGNMINGARQELSRDPTVWWTIMAAFSWMFVLVLSANLFADKVRDAFDPQSRSIAKGPKA
jgi:peptide/nickel transport system permease protein